MKIQPLNSEHLRFITKIALMYHEEGIKQPQIATMLGLPQARVSRLLQRATELGIVKTTVIAPSELFTRLERDLVRQFGLLDVIIADSIEGHEQSILGAAAATYLESTIYGNERLGISSWSASLLATADALSPSPKKVATEVVQIIGGVGNPSAQASATRLISRFAELTGGVPRYLAAPGVVGNKVARDALLSDSYIKEISKSWANLTTALVGIGALEPSPLLAQSGNSISVVDQKKLRKLGAVGDVCLHYFGADGRAISSDLEDRMLGISATTLKKVPRRIGVAGGIRKLDAIRAALLGGWINVLITDSQIAAALLSEQGE
jgi:DNA-binding transcriptional regulator LsrR (DeoR family)